MDTEFEHGKSMHADSSHRALALMHLVCAGCVERLGSSKSGLTDNGLGQRALRQAFKVSMTRLLDTRAFSQDLIGTADLSWSSKNYRRDWSSVGYDPKYRNIRRLTQQDELRFVALAKVGDRFAAQKLVMHHLPLLKIVARRYTERGLSLSELVNEGVFGLVKAIERFDIERKFRFGTYAKWWIRDAIEQALMYQGRLIRLPGHVLRKQTEQGQAHTLAENQPQPGDMAHEGASEAHGGANAEAAWDEHAEHEVDGVDRATPETAFADKQRMVLLERGLAELSERERQVVARRFGLYTDLPDTLEAVALDFGISYERVRQIQKAALGKLRSFLAQHYAALI